MRKLKNNEPCPIHQNSRICCGRTRIEPKRKTLAYEVVGRGIRVYPDGRRVCPPSVLKEIKNAMLRVNPYCWACERQFEDYRDVELSHFESKGIGGHKRDDRHSNLTLLHRETNRACGSQNLHDYAKSVRDAKKLFPCEVQ